MQETQLPSRLIKLELTIELDNRTSINKYSLFLSWMVQAIMKHYLVKNVTINN